MPDDECATMSCFLVKNLKIFEHQKKICNFIVNKKNRGVLVFHTVGSGKTITALMSAKCLMEKYPDKHVVIATPASLVSNFTREINRLDLKFKNKIKVESYQKYTNAFENKGYNICKNSILIIDEVHNLNGKGKRYDTFFNCAQQAFKVILLSATPVKNSTGEMSVPLSLLEGVKVPSKLIGNLPLISDPVKRSKATKMFLKCKISYFENQNKIDFPSLRNNVVKLKMSDEYYNDYYNVQRDIHAGLPEIFENTTNLEVFYNGIRRGVNLMDKPSPKIEWVARKIVESVKDNKKILVYSNWIDSGINILIKSLKAGGIPYSKVTGSMTKKEKDSNIKKFNSTKNVNIMLVSSSGSEGLNLKGVQVVVILEPHWNKTRVLQVIGRASRFRSHSHLPENERHIEVFHLLLVKPDKKPKEDKLKSADEILWNMSESKQKFIDIFYETLKDISIEKDKSCFYK